MQRFKEMKELQVSRSKSERLKKEQAREEKELARFSQMYPPINLSTRKLSVPEATANLRCVHSCA